MNFPKIGITLGDPGGIGPEVTLKALCSNKISEKFDYIIYGSSLIIKKEIERLKLDFSSLKKFAVFEISVKNKNYLIGKPNKINGLLSFNFFKKGVEEALKGNIQALVTSPISKESWFLANYKYSGHTDYLSSLFPDIIMSFWSKKFKIALFSTHLPLKEAIKKVKKKKLISFFKSLDQKLKKLSISNFEFLVCGLNPHAGENGFLGKEENEEILPAILECKKQGIKIKGPFPADTIFLKALNEPNKFIIALYHDQALIPFKLFSFREGVNFTLGLPFIRTSPSHGTGFDIAGKGKANPSSMIEAIKLACKLTQKIIT